MKHTKLLSIVLGLSVLVSTTLSAVPVLAEEVSDEIIITEDSEIIDEQFDSENIIEPENPSDFENWQYSDISNLLYKTGAFPKPEDFDTTGLPEKSDVFEDYKDIDDFSRVINQSIENKDYLIDISSYGLNINQVTSRIAIVINENPWFYDIENGFNYQASEEGIVQKIQLQPSLTSDSDLLQDSFQYDQKELDEKVDEIIAGINPCWSDEEIALYLHNWLCLNCEYDWDVAQGICKDTNSYLDAHSAYGAIINGHAVCQGYAEAYDLLLTRVGIACNCVISYQLNHMWNLIQIQKKNYYVDVTGNDSYYPYNCRYRDFMISESKCRESHRSNDWTIGYYDLSNYLPKSSADHDVYYWNNVECIMSQNNSLTAYSSPNGVFIHNYCNNTDALITDSYPLQSLITFIGNNIAIVNEKNETNKSIDLIDISTSSTINSYKLLEDGTIRGIKCENGIITYVLQSDDDYHYGTIDWSKYITTPDTVTVTFDSNGGSTVSPKTVRYNNKVKAPIRPTKDNFDFDGWYTDIECTEKFDFNSVLTSNITLYAKWATPYPVVCGQCIDVKSAFFNDIESSSHKIARYRVYITDTGDNASKYVSVSNKGILSTRKACNITIIPQYKEDNWFYDFDNTSRKLAILPKPVINLPKQMTYPGQTINIYNYFTDNWMDNGIKPVELTSTNPSIASIDNEGNIIAGNDNGTVTINAVYSIKNKDYATNTFKVSAKLTVKHPKFAKTSYPMQTGQTLAISMNNVTKDTDVEWSTSNSDKITATAQLDKKGAKTGKVLLTAKECGEFTLTASIDSQDYTCTIIVKEPAIKKAAIKIKVNKQTTVGLKNTKYKANQIEWHSEDETIATVNSKGIVKGITAGTVKIYTETGGVRNECTITVY